MTTGGAADPILAAAEIIADSPEWWTRLRAAHPRGPDGTCLGCRSETGWTPRWPCGPRMIADRAKLLHERRQGSRGS